MNLSKIQAKFQEKMKKSTDPDRKAEGFYLARPLIMTMMNPLLRSSYLLLVHQVISILLPFQIQEYLILINNHKDADTSFDIYIALRTCVLVLILSIVGGMAREHGARQRVFITAGVGQTLRTLSAEKLLSLNQAFIEVTDNSFISKILLFEIPPVQRFISTLPNLFVTPVSIGFSLIMIYLNLNIGIYSLVVLFVFIILVVAINYLYTKIIDGKCKYSSFGAKRTEKLNELIKLIKMVKLNSL